MNSVALDKNIHNRKEFDCGITELNNFLKLTANQQSNKDNSRTYVIEDKNDKSIIIGFYTLTMISVELNLLSNHGAGLVARLAVSKKYKNRGIGSWLVVDALSKLLNASENVGFAMIIVDAKDGKKSFYKKFGFQSFKDEENKMYISVRDVRRSFKQLT